LGSGFLYSIHAAAILRHREETKRETTTKMDAALSPVATTVAALLKAKWIL
jgi:hypothetical protein